MTNSVRGFESFPDGMLNSVMQSTSQVGDLYDELEDGMWERVGTVASRQYRKDFMSCFGYTVAGQPKSRPVVARRSTFE